MGGTTGLHRSIASSKRIGGGQHFRDSAVSSALDLFSFGSLVEKENSVDQKSPFSYYKVCGKVFVIAAFSCTFV